MISGPTFILLPVLSAPIPPHSIFLLYFHPLATSYFLSACEHSHIFFILKIPLPPTFAAIVNAKTLAIILQWTTLTHIYSHTHSHTLTHAYVIHSVSVSFSPIQSSEIRPLPLQLHGNCSCRSYQWLLCGQVHWNFTVYILFTLSEHLKLLITVIVFFSDFRDSTFPVFLPLILGIFLHH